MPIGVGINSGVAYVGSIGEGSDTELTAMGDTVNVAARLATSAAAGELLVSEVAAQLAGVNNTGERRTLMLKGKSEATRVVVLTASQQT